MRNIILIFILFFLALLYPQATLCEEYSLFKTERPKVYIELGNPQESLDQKVASFIGRELRSLKDLDVVSNKADAWFSFHFLSSRPFPGKEFYIISVVITAWSSPYEVAKKKATECQKAGDFNYPYSEYEFYLRDHFIVYSESLKRACEDAVVIFDNRIMKEIRKDNEDLRKAIKDYKKAIKK